MTKGKRPMFGPEWPRYAIAAHVVFWIISTIFLASCLGACIGSLKPELAIYMLVMWIVAGLLIGAAATCSGKLYVGNQIFSRAPTTGVAARLYGAFLCLGTAVLLILGYAITHIRGA